MLRFRRISIGLMLVLLLSVSSAQQELLPAPENLFRALVTGDASSAALTYHLLGDPQTALAYADTFSEPSPTLLRQKAEWALGLGRWDVAEKALEDLLLVTTPDPAWTHHQLGLLLAITDKQKAITHLETAWGMDEAYQESALIGTLTDNTNARILAFQVATVLAEQKYYALAERAFAESAIFTASPAESLASVGLMRALQGLDYHPWIAQAEALSPNSPQVHTLIGLAHRAAGRAFDSLNSFIIALNLSPIDPEINAQIAEAYTILGDSRSAAFWYSQAIALSNDGSRYQAAYAAAQTAIPPDIDPTLIAP